VSKARKNDLIDELANGYEQMLEKAVGDIYRSEQKTESSLQHLIHNAKDKVVELKAVSGKEAEQIAEYVARDLHHLGDYISGTGKELNDWLGFEVALLESEILDLLLKAADSTTVELILRNRPAEPSDIEYAVDEIAGPGTLVCKECGDSLELRRATRMISCQKCDGEIFTRETN